MPITSTELFALANNTQCAGDQACHWCAAPCTRLWRHDDPPPDVGCKRPYAARCPSNAYVCLGCWLFRKKRTTVTFLSGRFIDSRAPANFSWWLTEGVARAIDPSDYGTLYDLLLKPPKRFSLSLLDGQHINYLYLCPANDVVGELLGETPLAFSLNNIPMVYSVYELEQALKHESGDSNGFGPGVRALVRLLGVRRASPIVMPKIPPKETVPAANRKGGPIPDNTQKPLQTTKKVVRS